MKTTARIWILVLTATTLSYARVGSPSHINKMTECQSTPKDPKLAEHFVELVKQAALSTDPTTCTFEHHNDKVQVKGPFNFFYKESEECNSPDTDFHLLFDITAEGAKDYASSSIYVTYNPHISTGLKSEVKDDAEILTYEFSAAWRDVLTVVATPAKNPTHISLKFDKFRPFTQEYKTFGCDPVKVKAKDPEAH